MGVLEERKVQVGNLERLCLEKEAFKLGFKGLVRLLQEDIEVKDCLGQGITYLTGVKAQGIVIGLVGWREV